MLSKLVAVRHTNGVLGVDVGVARSHGRNLTLVEEQFGVARTNPAAILHFAFEMRKLGHEYRGLNRVQAAVHAEQRMVMALDAAMSANGAHLFRQLFVVGEQRTAVAITAQGLG